ncbi:hypothetical protein [Klebsiella oxytoca]|uniref:hypothetical protein n=1 Tax=Klebsiella oxytoca TaxID=571 RepID=UPI0011578E6E|nr:hypothetical protein [Klebsiella oxytoca]HCB1503076.1 hypothetical protein [Klebsiella michiganensis]HCB1849542.1 hypothetical protein [Klebsiella oxytoca]
MTFAHNCFSSEKINNLCRNVTTLASADKNGAWFPEGGAAHLSGLRVSGASWHPAKCWYGLQNRFVISLMFNLLFE